MTTNDEGRDTAIIVGAALLLSGFGMFVSGLFGKNPPADPTLLWVVGSVLAVVGAMLLSSNLRRKP